MNELRDAMTLNGRSAVGARVRRSMPSMLVRARNWSATATKPCTDAIFTKVHGRRPQEEAS